MMRLVIFFMFLSFCKWNSYFKCEQENQGKRRCKKEYLKFFSVVVQSDQKFSLCGVLRLLSVAVVEIKFLFVSLHMYCQGEGVGGSGNLSLPLK